MRNYKQHGDIISVTAPYAVTPGSGVLVGSLFGVAVNSAAQGGAVEVLREGVVAVAKPSAEVWAQGDPVFWNDSTRVFTTSSGALIGLSTDAYPSLSTSGNVLLQSSGGAVYFTKSVTGGISLLAGTSDVVNVIGSMVGNSCVGIGDSIMRCQGVAKDMCSFLEYAAALSAGAMNVIANFGTNGAKSADVLATQVPLAIASTAKYVLIMEVANDALNSVTLATHRANMTEIVRQILVAGKVPIIVGAPPTSTYNNWRYNAADHQIAQNAGVAFVNPWYSCVKNGVWIDTTYSIDGTHPTPKASRMAGADLWSMLQTIFIGSADLTWTDNDPDGMFAGGLNLTNVAGVPTGWTGAAGVTHSCSEAGTGDVVGNWWKQTATDITAWKVSGYSGVAIPANWVAGDLIRMSARLRTVGFEANGSAENMSYAGQGKIGAYVSLAWQGGTAGEITLREIDGDINGIFSAYGVLPPGNTLGNLSTVITQTAAASGEFSVAQFQVHNLSLLARQLA